MIPSADWMSSAVCAQVDPELFSDPTMVVQAKRVCNSGCPVRDECLSYALTQRLDYGVYGGTSPSARARLRSGMSIARRRDPDHDCGTPAGYKRHQREHSPKCHPCIAAESEYRRRRKELNAA